MGNTVLKIYLIVSCSVLCLTIFGQQSKDVSFFEKQLTTAGNPSDQNKLTETLRDKNAFQNTGVFLFGIYRNMISSQDGSTCVFYPTCSSYCRLAIKNHGLFAGGVMTLDRLTRCHNFSTEKYSIDMSRRKLIDDVE